MSLMYQQAMSIVSIAHGFDTLHQTLMDLPVTPQEKREARIHKILDRVKYRGTGMEDSPSSLRNYACSALLDCMTKGLGVGVLDAINPTSRVRYVEWEYFTHHHPDHPIISYLGFSKSAKFLFSVAIPDDEGSIKPFGPKAGICILQCPAPLSQKEMRGRNFSATRMFSIDPKHTLIGDTQALSWAKPTIVQMGNQFLVASFDKNVSDKNPRNHSHAWSVGVILNPSQSRFPISLKRCERVLRTNNMINCRPNVTDKSKPVFDGPTTMLMWLELGEEGINLEPTPIRDKIMSLAELHINRHRSHRYQGGIKNLIHSLHGGHAYHHYGMAKVVEFFKNKKAHAHYKSDTEMITDQGIPVQHVCAVNGNLVAPDYVVGFSIPVHPNMNQYKHHMIHYSPTTENVYGELDRATTFRSCTNETMLGDWQVLSGNIIPGRTMFQTTTGSLTLTHVLDIRETGYGSELTYTVTIYDEVLDQTIARIPVLGTQESSMITLPEDAFLHNNTWIERNMFFVDYGGFVAIDVGEGFVESFNATKREFEEVTQ